MRRGILSRRAFAREVAGGVVGGGLAATLGPSGAAGVVRVLARAGARHREVPVDAILFDALPVFDPTPVARAAEAVFPGRGAELIAIWRARQFEYSWLRVAMHDYADFRQCTEDALRHAVAAVRLELTPAAVERLMAPWRALPAWPEAGAALEALRGAGLRLGLLSNFTPEMLEGSLHASGLAGAFDHVLSTDRARTFKPDPRAYRLGTDALRLPRERILFAAFAGWDAAGATRFGYPTFWVNRRDAAAEELGVTAPLGTGRALTDLVAFMRAVARPRSS